jgi:hypothetical protein
MPEQEFTKEDHEKFAKGLFNLTWDLLDKTDRTKEDIDKMINAAHASRYHWGEIGTPTNIERGEWQISRVYSVIGRSEPALYHAKNCLDICEENSIRDFDIAFAYEAMARANTVAKKKAEAKKYLDLANEAGEQIENKEDKDYFLKELQMIKG